MPASAPTTLAASNPVVLENQLAGSTGWRIPWTGYQVATDAGGQIKAYASATSVNKGSPIAFKVSVKPAQSFTIGVYRMGWYGGAGGRYIFHTGPYAGITQKSCPSDANGTIACAWTTSYTLNVPTTWVSGIYLTVLSSQSSHYQTYIVFTVRDDARVASVLYQQPVTTYEAYNDYPADGMTGKSLYTYNSYGAVTTSGTVAAAKVSFDRPYTGAGAGDFLTWEVYLVHWLERQGYDVSYSTDVDTHEHGTRLSNYRVLISAGHGEYWSKQMFDAAQNARDAGVNLAFVGANNIYWQVRFEASSTGVPDRIVVCYKSATADPINDPSLKTILWRDVGRPEQALIGIQYSNMVGPSASLVVTQSAHWIYRGTGFSNGSTVAGVIGNEGDRLMSQYALPSYRYDDLIAKSPYTIRYSTATDYANTSIYQAPSRAWVFATGTHQWSWGLDRSGYVDARIQQTTANVMAAMLDTTPPSVTAPTATLAPGTSTVPVTVSWSGSDAITFVDAYGLQQSTDGGAFTDVALPSAASTSVTLQLAAGHTYRFRVRGEDAGGNWSAYATSLSYTVSADTEAPSAPTNLVATPLSSSSVGLSWTASSDNFGVAGYRISRNGSLIATVTGTTYSDSGLLAGTTYGYTVAAFDAAGNVSAPATTSVTTPSADTVPPSAPTNLSATGARSGMTTLAWDASTDNVGVAGYRIYRNGSLYASTTKTSYSVKRDRGTYYVLAFDAAGNASGPSNSVTV